MSNYLVSNICREIESGPVLCCYQCGHISFICTTRQFILFMIDSQYIIMYSDCKLLRSDQTLFKFKIDRHLFLNHSE